MNKKNLYIQPIFLIFLFLIIVFSGLRFLWLDRFPIGITHDEIEYILSSKTYFLKGVDLSGVSFPISIFKTKTEGIISFLVPILLSPYYGSVNINQFTSRLPYVLLSLATIYVLFLLLKKLFNKQVALISVIVFLLNPWSFYFSRLATDVAFALFFSLLGIYSLITFSGKKLILPFIFFTLTFFSYHGAKPLIVPIVFICLFYRFKLSKPTLNLKQLIVFFTLSAVLVFGYFFIGRIIPDSINTSRSQDIVFLNSNILSGIVDSDRKISLESPLRNIFSNKFTASTELFIQKYISVFSVDTLFVSGDNRATYRFGRHGLFYPVDFFFIIIGLISLFSKYKKKAIFIFLLILIAPISTALSTVETSVINRSFLLLPIFIILISFGIYTSYNFLINKTKPIFVYLLFSSFYLFLFSNFIYFYFFRFPVLQQENYFFSQRIIANYLIRSKSDQKIVVVAPEPREVFLETIFYFSKDNQKQALLSNFSNFIAGKYSLNNVVYVSNCPDELQTDTTYIINQGSNCLIKNSASSAITEDQFGGAIYTIVNDQLCDINLSPQWARFHFISDYSMERFDKAKFCQTWIRSF